MSRFWRQKATALWARAAFGKEETESLPQRGLRLQEEVFETLQVLGVSREQIIKLLEYVYSRPIGELSQELGGVGVALLVLANSANLDADACEDQEVRRVVSKPLSHFQERNKIKNEAGFITPDLVK